MRSPLGFLILCLISGPICGDNPAPATPTKAAFELLPTQHMVVNIKINDKGPYRLIFDTGAPVTLLSNKVAKEAGVLAKDFKNPGFSLFGSVGQFPLQSLDLNGARVEKLDAMVMDHPALKILSQAFGPIEGIVGHSFFARFKMTLDYQAKEMTFVPNGFQPPDLLKKMMALVMGSKGGAEKRVLAPAGQLGFRVAKEAEDKDPGVEIKEVFAGGSAAEAGLKAGDRLLKMDGSWTDTVGDCYLTASQLPAGEMVSVTFRRDGKESEIKLKVRSGF